MTPSTKTSKPLESSVPRLGRYEIAVVGAAMMAAFALGAANLSVPSFWHDELVHVFVAKSIVEDGTPHLPSGKPYYNGTVWNVLLAAVTWVWGISERSMRTPSVVFASLNVLLTFAVLRPLLGRATALTAAIALAISPWTVAWSREARFYSLQQGLYLTFILAVWQSALEERPRLRRVYLGVACAAFGAAILSSYHSILFLGPVGLFALAMVLRKRAFEPPWSRILLGVVVLGLASLAAFVGLMNPVDREAVFDRGGLGGALVEETRSLRTYYTHWLRMNLGNGFFALALFGFAAMVAREKKRGWYAAAAFWVPILVLTFLIGYRRPRFMFFAFPFYVAAYSYGAVVLARWLAKPKATWPSRLAAAAVLIFAARLALSVFYLSLDALESAQGAHTTLARRHPQWKEPCAYVREHLEDRVVLTTTYLPVLYYVGHVDNWYPTLYIWWEADELGHDELKGLEELWAYVADHPKGYFIAEWWRFSRNPFMADALEWCETNMTRVDEASTEDVTLYRWGAATGQ